MKNEKRKNKKNKRRKKKTGNMYTLIYDEKTKYKKFWNKKKTNTFHVSGHY